MIWFWCGVIIVGVIYLYHFNGEGGQHDSVVVCWFDGRVSAGGDGWFYPNRFCRLRCRFGVPSVMSFSVLCVLYMCLFVEVRVIRIIYMLIFILVG